jgi:hypothetical protein
VSAFDRAGRERWRYAFPADEDVTLLDRDLPLRTIGGDAPEVLVASTMRVRHGDNLLKEGVLTNLDAAGRLLHTFAFDDVVTVGSKAFGPPWMLTSFAVDEQTGARRIAVAGHHAMWDPGVVTVLDDQWKRQGTFVHAGWIEGVRWLGSDRLIVSGFSNPHDGGMVALVAPSNLAGQGPEPPGSPSHCGSCGPIATQRMVILPRSEVNRATRSRFNRAVVQVTADRVMVSTIETDTPDAGIHGAVAAFYEFTHDLELKRTGFGEQYWATHRALEATGVLDHPRERCRESAGPREVNMWAPDTGWRTVPRLD